MKPSSRMRLGTEEDLLRAFGPDGFMIGIPVRPKPEDELEVEHHDVVVDHHDDDHDVAE